MSINNATIVGRLTKDVEVRKTQSGKSVAQFTIACNRDFGNNDEADFISCVAWGKTAENMGVYCHKGMQVGVTGRIQTRNYEDRDGKKVYITEVVCNVVQFLESKNSSNDNSISQNKNASQNAQNEPQSVYPSYDDSYINADDLPF